MLGRLSSAGSVWQAVYDSETRTTRSIERDKRHRRLRRPIMVHHELRWPDKAPASDMLSICITVKNRSRVAVDGRDLTLLPNCIRSIASSVGCNPACEIVVSDWGSDDWPLDDWLMETAAPLPAKITPLEGTFSRGRGLNAAARSARGSTLFFLDADMLVSARALRAGHDAISFRQGFLPGCLCIRLSRASRWMVARVWLTATAC